MRLGGNVTGQLLFFASVVYVGQASDGKVGGSSRIVSPIAFLTLSVYSGYILIKALITEETHLARRAEHQSRYWFAVAIDVLCFVTFVTFLIHYVRAL